MVRLSSCVLCTFQEERLMKAALLYGPEDLRMEDVKTLVCKKEEMLIRVHGVGLCGSDIRTIIHGHHRLEYPQILGHEIAGEIAEIGEGVKGFSAGERVYVSPLVPCYECPACKRGWLGQCENLTVPGTTIPGGFAEYMIVTEDIIKKGQVIKMPHDMSYEEAVMTEPLSSVFSCQEYANVTLGDTVVVIGMGPIGCLQLELAKLRGAKRVIAVEPSRIRLEKAREFGADFIIDPFEVDPVKRVREITGGWGAEVVISANPSTKAQDQAIKMACKRGKVVFFGGVPKGEMTLIDSNFVHYEQITILGHFGYDHMQNARSFDLIADKKIKADRYVTHVLPLEDAMKGVEMAKSGEAIKVVLKP